jgi:hypothetical protein
VHEALRLVMRTLSYTNVTATLALFVALGGTSFAAVKLTGANVRNGTVTGSDLRNESVKGRDVSGLTGRDVKNGSLTNSDLAALVGADFKAGQLAAGPAGPQGPAGTTQALTRRATEVVLPPSEAEDVIATCLPGEVAVGGGGIHDGTLSEPISVMYSHPVEADGSPPEDGERATGWSVGGRHEFHGVGDLGMTAYVLCANA